MVAQRSAAFNLDLACRREDPSVRCAILMGTFRAGVDGDCPRDATGTHKRGLCQSVCSSAICLTRRTKQTCGSTCRAWEHPLRSSCRSIGKPAGRAASRSSTTRIAPSPRKRSGGSTSNRSRAGRWRSAKRGRARTVARRAHRDPAGSAARGQAARRQVLAVRGRAASRPPRPGGFAPTARRRRRHRPGAQPQLRPRRAAQEQAQAAAQGQRPRPAGPDQGASGQPALRRGRRLARTGRRCRRRQRRDRRQRRRPTPSQLPQKTTSWTTTRD